MMNFPGVFNSDLKIHQEMSATRQAGKVIGGHYASPDLGIPFHGYVAGGPEDDHEGTRREDAVARLRQGMKPMLRFGSAWHDVDAQIRAVTELGLDSRHFILCTDDSHSETLVNEGHVNRAVMRAIAQGVPPITALQMATLNTAEHFGVSRDVGMIAAGRFADILLVDDLANLTPRLVVARGEIAVQDGVIRLPRPDYSYPEWTTSSIHLGRSFAAEDFILRAPAGAGRTVIANVIGVIENQAPTRHLRMDVPVVNEEIPVDMRRDLVKVAVIERHQGSGAVQVGFVQGFGFNVPCAIGSTVAHDSHQMIIVGSDESCMAKAQ
jgi:adenine deaminase